MDDNCKKEILVVCDSCAVMNEHMAQMISKARILADKGGHLVSVLYIGDESESTIKEISECGADFLILGIGDVYKRQVEIRNLGV